MNRRLPRSFAIALVAIQSLSTAVRAQELVTPTVPGVVAAGTPMQLLKEGYEAVEGPLPQADGGVIFSNSRAHRIERIGPDGMASVWWEGAGGANGLTVTPKGEIAATLTEMHAIGIVEPGRAARVLVDAYQGTPFNRPNDLVASRRGDIYFTDTVPPTATGPGSLPSALYRWSAKGELTRIDGEVARPNGVALSPDERTLYLANTAGEWVYAYDVDRQGRASNRREFARLMPPSVPGATGAASAGADGLTVDEQGRLYVATTLGVQVFSPSGAPLGTIALPKPAQNLAFAGEGRTDLIVVGRGAVYRIATRTHGPKRAGK